MAIFSDNEWNDINKTLQEVLKSKGEPFGFPEFREKSVVLGSFNIREFGKIGKRSRQSWDFLKTILLRFDLIAIQEVQDELEGIRHLQELLNAESDNAYGLVVSDTTGKTPGLQEGSAERLAFLFRWARIRRTEVASDISYDRASIVNTLLDHREEFNLTFKYYQMKLAQWEKDKSGGSKPTLDLPIFLTFIRQPHCASFEVAPAQKDGKPYELLLVNAHLLYGNNKYERKWEFDALIKWLVARANEGEENIIMMGDCNLEFQDNNIKQKEIEEQLKGLNKNELKTARVNFPLLDPHPKRGLIRTNARDNQTYDQIAIFAHDGRLPSHEANKLAGEIEDGYDYGAVRFIDLFAKAFHGKTTFDALNPSEKQHIIDCTQWDISDHMPVWFRLPIPE